MIATDLQWLQLHRDYMYVSTKVNTTDAQMIYDIFNRLTGQKKAPNGCGSCMRNTIKLIKQHYEKATQTNS